MGTDRLPRRLGIWGDDKLWKAGDVRAKVRRKRRQSIVAFRWKRRLPDSKRGTRYSVLCTLHSVLYTLYCVMELSI